MCGHGIIAVTTIALERGLIAPRRPGEIVLDTPAGQIAARARPSTATASRVADRQRELSQRAVVRPASERAAATRRSRAAGRRRLWRRVLRHRRRRGRRDSDQAADRLDDLRRAGMAIKRRRRGGGARRASGADGSARALRDDLHRAAGLAADADLRNVTIFADAEVDRSPCGTGHLRGDGGAVGDGHPHPRADVHAREHPRHAISWPDRVRS